MRSSHNSDRSIPVPGEEMCIIGRAVLPLLGPDTDPRLRIESLHIVIAVQIVGRMSRRIAVSRRQMQREYGAGGIDKVKPIIRISIGNQPVIVGAAPHDEMRHSVPIPSITRIDEIVLSQVVVFLPFLGHFFDIAIIFQNFGAELNVCAFTDD